METTRGLSSSCPGSTEDEKMRNQNHPASAWCAVGNWTASSARFHVTTARNAIKAVRNSTFKQPLSTDAGLEKETSNRKQAKVSTKASRYEDARKHVQNTDSLTPAPHPHPHTTTGQANKPTKKQKLQHVPDPVVSATCNTFRNSSASLSFTWHIDCLSHDNAVTMQKEIEP